MQPLAAGAGQRRAAHRRWPAAKPIRATTWRRVDHDSARRWTALAASTDARRWCSTATPPTLFLVVARSAGAAQRPRRPDDLRRRREAPRRARAAASPRSTAGVRRMSTSTASRSPPTPSSARRVQRWPLLEAAARPRHGRAVRRGRRRDGSTARPDRRTPADTQAVRRAAGQVPGAAAPRGRHADRAGAGQVDGLRRGDGGRRRRRRTAPPHRLGREGPGRPAGTPGRPRPRSSCTARWA